MYKNMTWSDKKWFMKKWWIVMWSKPINCIKTVVYIYGPHGTKINNNNSNINVAHAAHQKIETVILIRSVGHNYTIKLVDNSHIRLWLGRWVYAQRWRTGDVISIKMYE